MFTQGKWEIDDYGDRWIIVPEDRTRVILAIGQVAPSDKANAERICLCVNLHDELVEALQHVLKQVNDIDAPWWMTNPDRGGIDEELIKQALQAAGVKS
ncbi:hypothetical protein LCGC14_2380530 [marine sediment metagenome]|uniref:Uncharacterized protein n=1 Tax=marine sediment metagenome TaxID=412755 RepID=A0A0F9C122_9ZZZZ